jgi:hypothetical protein
MRLGFAALALVLCLSNPSQAQDKKAGDPTGPEGADVPKWRELQAGLDYATFDLPATLLDREASDGKVYIVRVDPLRAPLLVGMASALDGQSHTAAEWCRKNGWAVAINMGMYRLDRLKNVGYARFKKHVNNPRWVAKYKSALALDSRPGHKAAVMMDLDGKGARASLAEFETVIQNLRLIQHPGKSAWSTASSRRWSEAAVAADGTGRILFVFSRAPLSMGEFTRWLLTLPIHMVAAMHVEGGPEASLSIHAGGVDLDLNGSYETGFNENEGEKSQWPIPNVLGVAAQN